MLTIPTLWLQRGCSLGSFSLGQGDQRGLPAEVKVLVCSSVLGGLCPIGKAVYVLSNRARGPQTSTVRQGNTKYRKANM